MPPADPSSTNPADPLAFADIVAAMSSVVGEGTHDNGWTANCADEQLRADLRGGVVVVEISGPDPGPMRFIEVRSKSQLNLLLDYLRHKCLPGRESLLPQA
jgi:hypothetical protein